MPPRKKAAKASQLRDSIEEDHHTIFIVIELVVLLVQ
jgi:hypothetical protein